MSRLPLIMTGLAAGAVVVVMLLLAFEPANIALAGAAVAVLGALIGRADIGREPSLPQLPGGGRSGGQRHEIAQLSWSIIDRDGRVTEQGMRELRAVAAGRLRTAGIHPDDDDAVAAALGARGLRTLRAFEPPTSRAFDDCLTSLETLQGDRP